MVLTDAAGAVVQSSSVRLRVTTDAVSVTPVLGAVSPLPRGQYTLTLSVRTSGVTLYGDGALSAFVLPAA